MKAKRTGMKNRNGRAASRKPDKSTMAATASCLLPWLKIFEDGDTREEEWFGELCAPKSKPLSTRRKR